MDCIKCLTLPTSKMTHISSLGATPPGPHFCNHLQPLAAEKIQSGNPGILKRMQLIESPWERFKKIALRLILYFCYNISDNYYSNFNHLNLNLIEILFLL